MRSVFFHLVGATRQSVAERLPALGHPHGGWYSFRDSTDPVLFLTFYDDLLKEAEPSDLEALIVSLGMLPTVTVMVDVSGKVPGDVEVREFADFILSEFRGVAWDDFTPYCWTLPEIQSGANAHGHPFFDHAGW